MLKRGLEEYTHTDDGAVYAIADCPQQENPLHLIPHALRQDFLDTYGLYIEGELCPLCALHLRETYDHDIYRYGYACDHGFHGQKRCPKCGEMAIQSRRLEDVVYSLVAPRYNYGSPKIVIARVNDNGSLVLEHERNDLGLLDLNYAKKTLEYLHALWKRPVHLKTFNSREEATTLTYSTSGMEIGK